jgi:hypothetical protein
VTLDPGLDKLDGDESVRRAAQIEANTRRVNEAIEAGSNEAALVFICECGRVDCGTTLLLEREQYEAVRTAFDRFFVVPGHELPEIESVVERHDGYLVVSKRDPEAREVVAASDPRSEG